MAAMIAVALTAGLFGCSTSAGKPDYFGDPATIDSTSSTGLDVQAATVFGRGRAVRALTLPDTRMAIVTTTGVYLAVAPGADVTELERFDSMVETGPVAFSPDSSALGVGTAMPPSLRVFDLAEGTATPVQDLPVAASIRNLQFATGGTRLVVDTTSGPFLADDWRVPVQAGTQGPTTSMSAILPNGTVFTPLTQTAIVAVDGVGGSSNVSLPIPSGMTVLDARASASGSVVAVLVSGVTDDLERTSRIVVLDSATLQQRGIIDIGDPLESVPSWGVTDEGVEVGSGSSMRVWALDGAPLTVGESPSDSPIVSVYQVTGGVLTVHQNGALVRWASGTWSPTLVDPGGVTLNAVDISQDGSTATTVNYFGLITIWNVADGAVLATDDRFAVGEATGVAVAPDGTIAVASSTGRVSLLSATGEEESSITSGIRSERVGAVSFDPASGAVATGLAERRSSEVFDDSVTVWDGATGAPRFSVGGEGEQVLGCSFFYSRIRYSPDGALMAVASHDFGLEVRDAETGELLHELSGTSTILDEAFTPDGRRLVATYDDGTVDVWQTSDFSLLTSYRAGPGGYSAISIAPDGATMAVTDIVGAATVIDVMSGAVVRTLMNASFRSTVMARSPDGALLALPTANGGIGIWSIPTGEQVTTLTGHAAEVTGLAFSPDGRELVSSSSDGTARIWALTARG